MGVGKSYSCVIFFYKWDSPSGRPSGITEQFISPFLLFYTKLEAAEQSTVICQVNNAYPMQMFPD